MEIQAILLIILAIPPPTTGIVGFFIQLRNTKKLCLENEKSQLEINQFKQKAEQATKRIIERINERLYIFLLSK